MLVTNWELWVICILCLHFLQLQLQLKSKKALDRGLYYLKVVGQMKWGSWFHVTQTPFASTHLLLTFTGTPVLVSGFKEMNEFHGNFAEKGMDEGHEPMMKLTVLILLSMVTPNEKKNIQPVQNILWPMRKANFPSSWHPHLGNWLIMISLDSDNMALHALFCWKRKITRDRMAKPILSRKQLNYHKICIFLFLCSIIFLIWSVSGSILIMFPSQSNQIKLWGPRKQNANVLSWNEHFSWGHKTTNLN